MCFPYPSILVGAMVTVAADLLALTLLEPPGSWGADVVFGTAQACVLFLFSIICSPFFFTHINFFW